MQGKPVNESQIVMASSIQPSDASSAGNAYAGVIIKFIDDAARVVGMRHARRQVTTVSIDRLDFRTPVFVGDLVTCKASVNMVGRTSMEIGVRVEAENTMVGEVRHTSSAYVTVVALDENRHPVQVPPLILESEEQKRRNREAMRRRGMRTAEKELKEWSLNEIKG